MGRDRYTARSAARSTTVAAARFVSVPSDDARGSPGPLGRAVPMGPFQLPDEHRIVSFPFADDFSLHDGVTRAIHTFPSANQTIDRFMLQVGHALPPCAANNKQRHHERQRQPEIY